MTAGVNQDLWFDRDLGWLEFNRRVLAEAQDRRTPLLERLKFLAIFTSNLDEFFMKRFVAFQTERNAESERTPSPATLRAIVIGMLADQRTYLAAILSELEGHGVRIVGWDDLDEGQQRRASVFFADHVSPALTPQVVDAVHPVPFLSNLSLSWACRLHEPGADAGINGRVITT